LTRLVGAVFSLHLKARSQLAAGAVPVSMTTAGMVASVELSFQELVAGQVVEAVMGTLFWRVPTAVRVVTLETEAMQVHSVATARVVAAAVVAVVAVA